MDQEVKCSCVVLPLRSLGDDYKKADFDNTILEILKLRESIDFLNEQHIIIKIRSASKKKRDMLQKRMVYGTSSMSECIELNCSVKFEEAKWILENNSGKIIPASYEEKFSTFLAEIETALYECLSKIVMAANISRPGIVSAGEGFILINNKFYAEISGFKSKFDIVFKEKENKWPKFIDVPIKDAYEWLDSNEDVRSGYGQTNLGRSLALFSNLFFSGYDRDSPIDCVCVIIAIEALYGSNGSKRDLIDRISIVLGNKEKVRLIINHLYQERSNIVHGSRNIPFWFIENDDVLPTYYETVGKFMKSALQLLLSSYQRMICLGIKKLEFETILKNEEAPNQRCS